MGKHFKYLLLFVIIFTTILFTYNCKKDEGNKPPAIPLNITPANNEDSVSVSTTLEWTACADPENDSVKYDVYLGQSNPPDLVSSNLIVNSYKPDTLLLFTKYYWKVVAKDSKNNAASSSLWNFTTAEPAPGDLQVFVCNLAGTIYYGNAEVFVYTSYSERQNDISRVSFYRKALTDSIAPGTKGAIIYALPFQQYYIFCRYDKGGGVFLTGEAIISVPKGKKSKLTVNVS